MPGFELTGLSNLAGGEGSTSRHREIRDFAARQPPSGGDQRKKLTPSEQLAIWDAEWQRKVAQARKTLSSKKVRFDDKIQEENTHSSRMYDRTRVTANDQETVFEDRIGDLGYTSDELDTDTKSIMQYRVGDLKGAYSNSKATYNTLELKLGANELGRRTGIKSRDDIYRLMHSANSIIERINDKEADGKALDYLDLNKLLDIVDKVEDMEEKLEELWQEVRPPKRDAALSAEEKLRPVDKKPRRSQ